METFIGFKLTITELLVIKHPSPTSLDILIAIRPMIRPHSNHLSAREQPVQVSLLIYASGQGFGADGICGLTKRSCTYMHACMIF